MSKSVIMWVDPRCNKLCAEFDLESSRLKIVESIKYLDVYLTAGKSSLVLMSM